MRCPQHIRTLAAIAAACIVLTACKKQESKPAAPKEEQPKPAAETKAPAARPRVAYVTNGIASFWTIAKAGALTGGKDFGAEVDVRMPANGAIDQKNIIEDLLTRGIDGIAVSPIDADNQVDQLNAAAEKTHLITHDSDAPKTKRLAYIGMDNYSAGRMCGKLVKEALPNGGKLIIFIGRLEQDNAKGRRQGVIDEIMDRPADPKRYDSPGTVIKNDKYTILDTRTDQLDPDKGKRNAEDAITAYPDLDCMVGLFAYNPPGIIEALKAAGKLGKVKIVGFDEADPTLQGIKDGVVVGTVVQDPFRYGYESVRILTALAKGDKSVLPANGFLDIPAKTIRKDNVDAFWEELKTNIAKGQ